MAPAIEIFGITISEVTTTVTDYMITAVAWWLGAKLIRQELPLSRRLWGAGFLLIGFGAFLGGTSHGFATYLDSTAYAVIWKATVYTVGLSMLAAVAGTIEGSRLTRPWRAPLHGLNAIAFAIYAIWMVTHDDFLWVILHYVPAMIGVALLQAWAWWRHGAASAPWIIGGVLITLAGALVQQSRWDLHLYFNHNDLYHLIQIAGLLVLYRGCQHLAARAVANE